MIIAAASAFLLLAVAGTLLRVVAGNALDRDLFPFGTLLVNILGSLAIGLLAGSTPTLVTVIGVGGLGSLTTYSSLTREIIRRWSARMRWSSGLYLGVSLVGGIGAAWLGIQIAS